MSQRNKWLEILGRAGLKTVKFDTGNGGGQPEYEQVDFAHATAGLGREATAWAMYAYSNTDDEKSLSYITVRLSKIVRRKYPKIPVRSVMGLVKISLREHMMYAPSEKKRKGCSVTMKSAAMGIARKTYYVHRESIESAIELIQATVIGWEDQIIANVKKKMGE